MRSIKRVRFLAVALALVSGFGCVGTGTNGSLAGGGLGTLGSSPGGGNLRPTPGSGTQKEVQVPSPRLRPLRPWETPDFLAAQATRDRKDNDNLPTGDTWKPVVAGRPDLPAWLSPDFQAAQRTRDRKSDDLMTSYPRPPDAATLVAATGVQTISAWDPIPYSTGCREISNSGNGIIYQCPPEFVPGIGQKRID